MEKNTLIGFILIGAVLIGFSMFNRPGEEEQAQMRHYQDSIQAIVDQQIAKQAELERQAQALILQDSTSILYHVRQGNEEFITLENDLVKLQFTTKGGRVKSAQLKKYNGQDRQPVVLFDNQDADLNFAFNGKNENILTSELYFTPTKATDTTLTMRLAMNGGGYLDFNYKLKPDSYLVDFVIEAHGMQNYFAPSVNYVDIQWRQRARQQEKGFSFENQHTSLSYKAVGESSDYLSSTQQETSDITERLDWIAFKNQFFSSVLIAGQDFETTTLTSTPQPEGSGYLKNYEAGTKTFFDPTGKQPTQMQFYFGPNHFKTLQKMNKLAVNNKDIELEDLVYLGWPVIRWINRWFTINVFDWLSSWGLNMGIVLLLMTLIVKALVYPATYKSYMSSAKMRVLRPYVEEINKKYPKPEDAMKKQQETMALYSKYGVSPMGGCLPMLIQMPVFIALFNFVPNAIELRQQSFLWASDLSTYDDVIRWGVHIPFLGEHLSLFCLLFCVSNLLNTFIMMRQQDTGQQQFKAMKWMMYLMPIMFIFIFNSYSSGLNYYYFISGLISIIIMTVLRKTTDEGAILARLEARMLANKNNPRKQSGMMSKLVALQEEQKRLMQEREQREHKKKR